MKLIVGLGNPGREYENTRHNVGFRVIDELARRHRIDVTRRKFSGVAGAGSLTWMSGPRGGGAAPEQVLLLKPETYMNLSGRSVREAMTFHKIDIADLMVIVDDLALPVARLRVREKGSAGGHNGLTSVIAELGSDAFARLRIGIAWVEGKRMVNHVLGAFSAEEEALMKPAVARAADAIECWAVQGVSAAMNRFNKADEKE